MIVRKISMARNQTESFFHALAPPLVPAPAGRHRTVLANAPDLVSDASGTNQPGEMAMITEEEAERAGRRTLAVWAITSVVLLILGVLLGNGTIGGRKAAPPPQTSSAPAESQAPTGSQNP